jgi:hypothetical protein
VTGSQDEEHGLPHLLWRDSLARDAGAGPGAHLAAGTRVPIERSSSQDHPIPCRVLCCLADTRLNAGAGSRAPDSRDAGHEVRLMYRGLRMYHRDYGLDELPERRFEQFLASSRALALCQSIWLRNGPLIGAENVARQLGGLSLERLGLLLSSRGGIRERLCPRLSLALGFQAGPIPGLFNEGDKALYLARPVLEPVRRPHAMDRPPAGLEHLLSQPIPVASRF